MITSEGLDTSTGWRRQAARTLLVAGMVLGTWAACPAQQGKAPAAAGKAAAPSADSKTASADSKTADQPEGSGARPQTARRRIPTSPIEIAEALGWPFLAAFLAS